LIHNLLDSLYIVDRTLPLRISNCHKGKKPRYINTMLLGIKKGWGTNAKNLQYYDTVVVPIIENTPQEMDLTDRMAKAMEEYPDANAVLVR